MEYLKTRLTLLLIPLVLVIIVPTLKAQDASTLLTSDTPVNGQIGSGTTQIWSFNAVEGEVLSFVAHTTSGSLDPQIILSSTQGQWQIANDDYAYPNNTDALLEAISMPRTGNYTVTVSGAANSSGEYELRMLNGFSQIGLGDNFNGDLRWQDAAKTTDTTFNVASDNGQLALTISGPNKSGIAINPQQIPFTDYYASVKVTASGGSDGWVVGMTLRQSSPTTYYLLNLNSSGQWRLTAQHNGTTIIIREWTAHPALANLQATFTLSVMVSGTGFDFFYNGLLFGRLSDTTIPDTGVIGFSVSTASSLTSETTAYFDDLVMTFPMLNDGRRLVPEQITLGQPAVVTRDLERRGLIPAEGKLALNVPESFIESARPGVDRVSLARGATYTNLAMGTTVSWDVASQGLTGCGLIFQSTDDTNYTLAYVDQTGAFGVSQRLGDHFTPGIYVENPSAATNKHTLIVILHQDQLLYYVDGVLGGTMPNSVTEGSIGNAVVNFEPIRTSCKFTDTWVWNWDK